MGKASKDEFLFMRKSVGLIQPTCGHHHFKAAFLECPQRLKPIYFPADFTVIKVAPDFMCLPTGPSPGDGFWKVLFAQRESSGQRDCRWGTSHPLFIPSPLGASSQPCAHISARFPGRMGWPCSELSPV